ncbi:Rossmann fold nucleotide-binding protein Smf possibly involved in DNA uptake [Pseudanabaena sp. lw0831]|uniref:DNA-processing protein DprA n=1 Tax=Pseudanabaena sp. lw0831 TaxID=1357935 RepID=UPI001915F41E|nr:DNA-processing protein DprA [Pseudanabaena sp. lw0831]GBO54728.1 Rossmann fold nucleotide-binding protein Smf possibly involved in DNA uptake [Pseudanabaena sp. lw0831]
MSLSPNSERAYWLAWSQIRGIGPVLIKRLYQAFGYMSEAWNALPSDLHAIEGIGGQTLEAIRQAQCEVEPVALLAVHEHHNLNFWTPSDREYPQLLWEIPDPPSILYYHGHLTNWNERNTIAIVGTRNATPYGRRWTKKIVRALAERGFTIISGMAEGIDGEAHKACLEIGGQTVAVVGTGVDQIYPHRHKDLYTQILHSGLVVSEYPHGTTPNKTHFPARNRIIAGLSRVTLVMEAPERSGALITAYQANEYGRDVFALPNSLDVNEAKGCLKLLGKGAQAILGVDELLESLGMLPNLDKPAPAIAISELPLLQQNILQAIGFGDPVGLDWIVEQTKVPSGEVLGALTHLEIVGAIAPCPGMRYQRLV